MPPSIRSPRAKAAGERRPPHGRRMVARHVSRESAAALRPGGHLKFLHLWPGQIPPGATTGTRGLLLGNVAFYKTVGGLFETIAFASELDEHTAVHEPIEDGGCLCGVTKILVPVVDDSV